MNNITILIPTSPIPSCPSTEVIDECIFKLREYEELKNVQIIIMADGVHKSHEEKTERYNEYKTNLAANIGKYGNCTLKTFEEHTHQAGMAAKVLNEVTTPFIMFVEHDTAPIGDIPWSELIRIMEEHAQINYIRFHIFHEFLPEHNHLMLGEKTLNKIKLMHTVQWSQRPHLAKADWYRDILNRFFSSWGKTMIEDVMHGIVQESYFINREDYYGLYIYSPDGNKLRSYHSDGRGDDEKIIEGEA